MTKILGSLKLPPGICSQPMLGALVEVDAELIAAYPTFDKKRYWVVYCCLYTYSYEQQFISCTLTFVHAYFIGRYASITPTKSLAERAQMPNEKRDSNVREKEDRRAVSSMFRATRLTCNHYQGGVNATLL